MNSVLATVQRRLDFVYPSGLRIEVLIEFGPIYSRENHIRCPVSLGEFHESLPDIAGVDSLHAFLLAVDAVYSVLDAFVRRGGRLYYPGTDTVYDLSGFLCPTRRSSA